MCHDNYTDVIGNIPYYEHADIRKPIILTISTKRQQFKSILLSSVNWIIIVFEILNHTKWALYCTCKLFLKKATVEAGALMVSIDLVNLQHMAPPTFEYTDIASKVALGGDTVSPPAHAPRDLIATLTNHSQFVGRRTHNLYYRQWHGRCTTKADWNDPELTSLKRSTCNRLRILPSPL